MNQILVKLKPLPDTDSWICYSYHNAEEVAIGGSMEKAIQEWYEAWGKDYGVQPDPEEYDLGWPMEKV